MTLRAAALDDPVQCRHADRELLSLALIDARNLTLRWLEVFEARGRHADAGPTPCALWLAGHAGWYQEWWIGRHPQRGRGEAADASGPRLASIEPEADAWFDRPDGRPPDADRVRRYLADTLDTTLDLLASAEGSDAGLHFYRAALLHEDRLGQALAERAALLQLTRSPEPPPPFAPVTVLQIEREPLFLPASRLQLGSPPGGFVPDNERWAHELQVPAFEIDAQPVGWERFVEFAEDGGYDRRELWTDSGWAWLQATGRRAPRDVEQLRGGVLLQRGGEMHRAAPAQAASHLTRHEAEAWCRWAGRRLPTEPEWEAAALHGRHLGFRWGEVFEWVAGSARPWEGHAATPGSLDRMPPPRSQGVLRGACAQTPGRWRHPKARRFAAPHDDTPLCGFRSCAP